MLYHLLEDKFIDSYDEDSILAQDLFKNTLRKVAELILTIAFKTHLQITLPKIDQIMPFISILQHLIHQQSLCLPPSILTQLQLTSLPLILNQPLDTMRNIVEDSRNCTSVAHFYNHVYIGAFSFRVKQLGELYGVKMEDAKFGLYLLQCIT